MSERWESAIAGRRARQATIALVVLQIGGCVADLGSEQQSLMSAICLVGPSPALRTLGLILWLALALSWTVGLLAIRFADLRPVYWLLLALIPAAAALQLAMLRAGTLTCDGP